jgi:hypothetical protein
MERITLPPKQLAMFIKGIARETISADPSAPVTFEDLSALLTTSPSESAAFVNSMQRYIAAAAVNNYTVSEFVSLVDASSFSAAVREGLVNWWRDSKDEISAQMVMKLSSRSSHDAVESVSWKVSTETASSAAEAHDGGAEPRVALEFVTRTQTSPAAADDLKHSITCTVSKAVLADTLQQFARIRKELERAAATS